MLSGMVLGMATKKLTITLDERLLESVRKLVATGHAESISGFVQHAVSVSLADVAGWGAMLGVALANTGGPLTRAERSWADSVLKAGPRRSSKRRRVA